MNTNTTNTTMHNKLAKLIQEAEEGMPITASEISQFKSEFLAHFRELFAGEPSLMVITATNADAVGRIVPADEILEHVEAETCYEDEQEVILYNSIVLSDLA